MLSNLESFHCIDTWRCRIASRICHRRTFVSAFVSLVLVLSKSLLISLIIVMVRREDMGSEDS